MRALLNRFRDQLSSQPPDARSRESMLRTGCLVLSVTFCVALWSAYALRPDALAAVTLAPAWIWPPFGLYTLRLGWSRRSAPRGRTVVVATLVAWIAFVVTFVEEPRSLARGLSPGAPSSEWNAARSEGRALRVVSLNCALSPAAAVSLHSLEPDVVLVQEQPGEQALRVVAQRLFGEGTSVAVHGDAAIIARSDLQMEQMPGNVAFQAVRARIRLASAKHLDVVSLRLSTQPIRFDFWSPEFWTRPVANRRTQRALLGAIVEAAESARGETPLLIGGDFNAPQGDAIFDLLAPRYTDAFGEAGRGWGNTILASVPVLRIDQVWLSPELHTDRAFAVRVPHTDHRAVVCDLWLE